MPRASTRPTASGRTLAIAPYCASRSAPTCAPDNNRRGGKRGGSVNARCCGRTRSSVCTHTHGTPVPCSPSTFGPSSSAPLLRRVPLPSPHLPPSLRPPVANPSCCRSPAYRSTSSCSASSDARRPSAATPAGHACSRAGSPQVGNHGDLPQHWEGVTSSHAGVVHLSLCASSLVTEACAQLQLSPNQPQASVISDSPPP